MKSGFCPGPPVFTVIGSGGKTSLIWLLAQSQRQRRRVLVSPSAKMYPPPPELYDCGLFDAAASAFFRGGGSGARQSNAGGGPPAGISLAGLLNPETGKLEALLPGVLEKMVPAYDLVLLEGDGSRGLPLKGWADHEPAVPSGTSVTIAIIPISVLGKKISGETVFRLPRFLELCGAAEGDTVTAAHLAAVITAGGGKAGPRGGMARGLLSAARGEKLLFINQAEDERRREQARELVMSLPADFTAGLDGIIYGSVKQDSIVEA